MDEGQIEVDDESLGGAGGGLGADASEEPADGSLPRAATERFEVLDAAFQVLATANTRDRSAAWRWS